MCLGREWYRLQGAVDADDDVAGEDGACPQTCLLTLGALLAILAAPPRPSERAHLGAPLPSQHEGVDIVSTHAYPNLPGCYFVSPRFKVACPRQANLTVLTAAANAAALVGKPFYLGEYGGPRPNFTGPTAASQAFPESVLRWQVESSAEARVAPSAAPAAGRQGGASGRRQHHSEGRASFPPRRRSRILTSLWAWACPSHRRTMACLDPAPGRLAGATAEAQAEASYRMLTLLQQAEQQLLPRDGWL
jgi:hypothetical protein